MRVQGGEGGREKERARVRQLRGAIALAVSPPSNVKFTLQVDGDLSRFTSTGTALGGLTREIGLSPYIFSTEAR